MTDGSITHGDGIMTAYVRDERPGGWRSFKAPKGKRFVFLLLGTADKDAANFDADAALNDLGWHFRDRDASLAEDAKRLSPEGVAARAEGIAHG
jgi:hypothetical protein